MIVVAPGLMVMTVSYFTGRVNGSHLNPAITLAGLWASPISGASMNPARSLAPDLVRGNFTTSLIYIVGPTLGALIAVLFEWIMRGKPNIAGMAAAQGTLD